MSRFQTYTATLNPRTLFHKRNEGGSQGGERTSEGSREYFLYFLQEEVHPTGATELGTMGGLSYGSVLVKGGHCDSVGMRARGTMTSAYENSRAGVREEGHQ